MRFTPAFVMFTWLAAHPTAQLAAAQVPATAVIVTHEGSCDADPQAEIQRRFPSEEFIIGLGTATSVRDESDGQTRSRQAAMAAVGEQLESKVERAIEERTAEVDRRTSRSTNQNIKLSSSVVLKHVQYQLGCYRSASRQYQTWATLNKRDAVNSANAALADLNERSQRLMAEANMQLRGGRIRDALQRTADLRPMVIEAQQHLKVLRALSASSQSAFLDEAGLHAFEQQARDSAPIYIELAGQPLSTNARSLIATELTRRNLPVANSGRGAGFKVRGEVRQLSARYSELTGSLVVELEADVAIAYANQSDTIGSAHIREKGSGVDERAATLAAEVKLASSLGKSVASQFDKLLSSHEP